MDSKFLDFFFFFFTDHHMNVTIRYTAEFPSLLLNQFQLVAVKNKSPSLKAKAEGPLI